MAGKLTPYPAVMLGTNKTAMHLLGPGHGAQHAQQAQQQQAASDLIRSGVAQHAQLGAVDTQYAEEALSQEAAAAEAALGSFSRASSQTVLHSCHTTAAFPLPANAPTDPAAEAAAQAAAYHAAPSATQRPSKLTLASQQRGMNKTEPTQQVVSWSGRGLGASQGSKGGQPGVLPLQGYPAGETGTGARGLQLTAPNGQSLTQAQVNTTHLPFQIRIICQLCILTVTHCTTNMHGTCMHTPSQYSLYYEASAAPFATLICMVLHSSYG